METITSTATRVTVHEARRHFDAGGTVLVSEFGHEPTRPVTASTTVHTRDTTTWESLLEDVHMWRGRYPHQRFYTVG
jgi:hypothetical protein